MPGPSLKAPIPAREVTARNRASFYPSPFAERMVGREKRQLGEHFGLSNFGVNLTTLEPGAQSALKHRHSAQDELIYVISGVVTLVTDQDRYELEPGMCCGFPAAGGVSHHLVNEGDSPASYLEVGDRNPADEVEYPDDDLRVGIGPEGKRRYEHRDGTPY
jgi:uncharacterized cupin superfamily protein